MRYRLILPLAVLLATMLVAPAAQAKARVGLSEQSPEAWLDHIHPDDRAGV